MSRSRLVGIGTRVCIAGIVIGILFMIQPWVFELFKPGFLILLAATLSFIVVSHIPVPSSAAANPEVLEDVPIRLTRTEQ